MYLVVSYFNYRKSVSFQILKMTKSLEEARKYAYSLAEEDAKSNTYIVDGETKTDEVADGVENKVVDLDNTIYYEYTVDDGYDHMVYSVIEFEE